MPDEQLEIPFEVFDREAKWPKARKAPRLDPDHPAEIPDTPDGPFKDWIQEKVEDAKPSEQSSFRVDSPSEASESSHSTGNLGLRDEEIGYEGER